MKPRNPSRTKLLTLVALALAADFLACPNQMPAQATSGARIDRSAFASPPNNVRPTIRWWWPGGAVDDGELARELSVMWDAGFVGAEIQSFAVGLPPNAPSSVFTYGTTTWFNHLVAAVQQARALGMNIDLTLGSSWPSAGSYIQDYQSLKMLTVTSKVVAGPTSLDQPVPPPIKPLSYSIASFLLQFPDTYDATKMRRTAVLAVKIDPDQTQNQLPPKPTIAGVPSLPPTIYLDSTSVVDLTSSVTSDGKVHWQVPNGNWLLFALYNGPTGTRPFYGADPNALVLDHLNQDALNMHIKAIAQTAADRLGANFGTTLRSLFVDSLELRTELYWTDDFLTEFSNRRGYHLEPFLPILFIPLAADAYLDKVYPNAPPTYEMRAVGPRVRHDYNQTVSELMIERFFTPLRQWADGHGVGARLQAHGSPTDLLDSYAKATIPETEGLYAGGNPSFLKLAVSAGHLASRPIISSEVMDFTQTIATPTSMLAEANKHLAAGVNNLVFHGFPYVYDVGFARPGWMPFNSPYLPGKQVIGTFGSHLNDRNPVWQFMSNITDYVARAQMILRTGSPVVDLALYTGNPGYPDDSTYAPQVNKELTRNGYNYDYVNADFLLSASVVNGVLQIGTNHYKALVISDVQQMSPALADRILSFALSGLPILLVGDVPYSSGGYQNYAANDAAVQQRFQQLTGYTRAVLLTKSQSQLGSVLFVSSVSGIGPGLANTLNVAADVIPGTLGDVISYSHRSASGVDYYFVANASPSAVDTDVWFPNFGNRFPEIWDLQTGSIQTAVVYSNKGARTKVHLSFKPSHALVVGFDTAGAPVHLDSTDLPNVQLNDEGNVTGLVSAPGTYTIVVNSGTANQGITKTVTTTGPNLAPIGLSVWDLVASTTDALGNHGSQVFQKTSLRDLSTMPGLNNFSGLAIYTAYIDLTNLPTYLSNSVRVTLDLGNVNDAAQVRINGTSVGILITPPFKVDVTDSLISKGLNKIEITVTSSLGEMPAGLLGPVYLTPLYKVTAPLFTPLQMSVVVTPLNFPNNTQQDMINAIDRASQLVNHANFQWFWKTPPNNANPQGGAVVACNSVGPWVTEARRLNMGVTLQFQTFWTEVNGSYEGALDSMHTGAIPKVHVATPVAPFATATFADPNVSTAYLDQIACLAALKPDYLVLGPEVNFVYVFDRTEWNAYLPVYAKAYTLAKMISPTTQVGLSYQYDGLRRDHLLNNDKWDLIRQAGPADFIGLTTYYGYSDDRNAEFPFPWDIPADYYNPIRDVLGWTYPIIFTEIGWSSYYPGGLDSQAEFVRRMLPLLDNIKPDNICWALLHDVNYFEGPGASLNQSGLLTNNDSVKPSWAQAMLFKGDALFVATIPHVFAPLPMPFSVIASPVHFPVSFTQQIGFQAIATAGQISGHVSLQFAWQDRITGLTWNCSDIKPYTDQARQLGLHFTLQFKTYEAVPSLTPGQQPTVLLVNPIKPPASDLDTGPSFSNSDIRNAFLQQISCLAGLGADYIVLGPELNFLVGARPDEFNEFKGVYRQAYNLIKATSPNTQVGVSFQYDGIRANLLKGLQETYIEETGPQDFLGLTSYFGYSAASNQEFPRATDIPADYYSLIRVRFPASVPVVFTEVGWTSYFAGGSTEQVYFLNRLPLLLQDVKPSNVIWALQYDVSNYYQGTITPLNDMGLRQFDGSSKPAWDQAIWLKNHGLYTSAGTPQPKALP